MGGDHFLNLQPGTVVNGRYEVIRCLGTGSMGMVYACRHRELAGHTVAMKVLFSEVARDEVAAARFRNEIVASYGVSHPNVVRAYEYFRDGDLIAFTMEYIGGGDLADRIGGDDLIPVPDIVSMLTQMCSGVQAIHEAGIIHRDLKPENILLTSSGLVKITDFGIARCGTGPKLTEHGGVVGTIDYVCPEYLEQGQVDTRSDLYALGVLAYEMVTGEAPYKGKSVIETMTLRLRTDPEPPHHLRPECPIALSDIILKAMARNPEDRYQSAIEIAADLKELDFSMEQNTPEPVEKQQASFAQKIDMLSESGGMQIVGSSSDSSDRYRDEEDSGTLELPGTLVEELREEEGRRENDGTRDYPFLPSELAGSGTRNSLRDSGSGARPKVEAGAQVDISSSRLSSERIRELYADCR